jgi:hypothetical protein
MSTINLNELNQFVKNYYDQIGLPDLEAHHAGRIREWFKENLSLIGTYGHRDFARFGNWKSENEDDNHFGRADGWVSLSEEVPDIDHLTYGTGMLYIHGEMEIPENEDGIAVPKDNIFGDEFYHVDKTGATKHIYDDVVNPERYISWDAPSGDLSNSYSSLLRAEEGGAPSNRGDGGARFGYVWEFKEETHTGTIGDGRWLYETISDVTGGVYLEEKLGAPSANGETPSIFYDEEVYNVDNDRHHYPWIVINSTAPVSIKSFLEKYWDGQNGMYDSDLPELAVEKGTYPPHVQGGITYVKSGVDGILDYISPIDEVP